MHTNIETKLEEKPKSERRNLRLYTLRLRPDQLDFLKTLENASSFVREAIDMKIADTGGMSNEKVISLHEGYEELKEKIQLEEKTIQEIKNDLSEIENAIESAEEMIQICQNILDNKIKPERTWAFGGGVVYYVRAEFANKMKSFGRGDTEEEALTEAKLCVKEGLPKVQGFLKGYLADKNHYTKLLKAHQGRLEEMQAKLEKIKNCIM